MPQIKITLADNDVTRSAKVNTMLAQLKGSALTPSERVHFRGDNQPLIDQKLNAIMRSKVGHRITLAYRNIRYYVDGLNDAFAAAFAAGGGPSGTYLLIAGNRVLIAGQPVRMI